MYSDTKSSATSDSTSNTLGHSAMHLSMYSNQSFATITAPMIDPRFLCEHSIYYISRSSQTETASLRITYSVWVIGHPVQKGALLAGARRNAARKLAGDDADSHGNYYYISNQG
jgi:hypothetical protein